MFAAVRLHHQPHRRGDGGSTCTRCCFTVRHPTGMHSTDSSLRGKTCSCFFVFPSSDSSCSPRMLSAPGRTSVRDAAAAAAPGRAAPPGARRSPPPHLALRFSRRQRGRSPVHIGSVFTLGSRNGADRQTERLDALPGQRILSSCRSIPAICRNLSFLRCFSAIRARAVSSGSWV